MKPLLKISLSGIFSVVLLNSSLATAKTRHTPLRSFGDYMQIINPIIAGSLAAQEKGLGHFAIIYGQTLLGAHSIKLITKSGKWSMSKRPYIEGKKDRFEGMPSAHTASAWAAASYVRTFSDDYKYASIPLYITAAITGYSRVKAKEHTWGQVVGGAALAEIVTYVNSKLAWSNEYRSTDFYFGKDGATFSLQFKL